MKPFRFVLTLSLAFLTSLPSHARAQDAPKTEPPKAQTPVEKPKPQKTRKEAEKEFAEAMTGCQLIGQFTVEGKAEAGNQKPDRYLIAGVQKVQGDHWTFTYVHRGIPIPLVLRVLWAGNTPVMTLDEFTIAGMGTFSARLMFDLNADLYAGTWQHGDVGGLMFGRIERANRPERATSDVHEKLQKKVAVAFNREPLKNAFLEIAKQCQCDVTIDKDALKSEGYTQNMAQSFELEGTGLAAIRKIVERYDEMCLVIPDGAKPFVITTEDFARKQGLKIHVFAKPVGQGSGK
jgi:hypothetical protein